MPFGVEPRDAPLRLHSIGTALWFGALRRLRPGLNTMWPFMPTSSFGCFVFDKPIAGNQDLVASPRPSASMLAVNGEEHESPSRSAGAPHYHPARQPISRVSRSRVRPTSAVYEWLSRLALPAVAFHSLVVPRWKFG